MARIYIGNSQTKASAVDGEKTVLSTEVSGQLIYFVAYKDVVVECLSLCRPSRPPDVIQKVCE